MAKRKKKEKSLTHHLNVVVVFVTTTLGKNGLEVTIFRKYSALEYSGKKGVTLNLPAIKTPC